MPLSSGPPVQPLSGTSTNRVAIVKPQPIYLNGFSSARRCATRPDARRGSKFDAEFDATTLLFDCFTIDEPNRILLIGPALFNLAGALADMRIEARPSCHVCAYRIRSFDRQVQVFVEAPTGTRNLHISCGLGAFDVSVGPDLTHMFAGCRVIFTLSRNNALLWIQDWIRFNRDIHGANAVLIYDNASTDYESSELLESIRGVHGIGPVCVVEWPFTYGPQGPPWDSDFCQLGAWEHARRRFLANARSVMNSDIDELVLSRSGYSIFERTERGFTGIVRYAGRWVVGVEGKTKVRALGTLPRHRDFDTTLRPQWERSGRLRWHDRDRCPPKWTLVPARCPDDAQWAAHTVIGWWPAKLISVTVSYRHFREIGSDWKYNRLWVEPPDPTRHKDDAPLRAALARVDWER
jgi:hypothetical protein